MSARAPATHQYFEAPLADAFAAIDRWRDEREAVRVDGRPRGEQR